MLCLTSHPSGNLWLHKNIALYISEPVGPKLRHRIVSQQLCCKSETVPRMMANPFHAAAQRLRLPSRGLGFGFSALVKHAGAWPSAEHGGSGALPPSDAHVNVRVQEPWVGVLFHQAEDFRLGCVEAAPCWVLHVFLDGHLCVVVDVDLS